MKIHLSFGAGAVALAVLPLLCLACSSSSDDKGKTGGGTHNDNVGGAAGADNSSTDKFDSCTQDGENSAMPVESACGTFKAAGPYAEDLQLGPYGGQMDVNVGKGFENPDPMDGATCPAFR